MLTIIREILCSDDSVHIRLHQLLDKVDFLESFEGGGFDDIDNGDDVFRYVVLLEEHEELEFAKCTKRKHDVTVV